MKENNEKQQKVNNQTGGASLSTMGPLIDPVANTVTPSQTQLPAVNVPSQTPTIVESQHNTKTDSGADSIKTPTVGNFQTSRKLLAAVILSGLLAKYGTTGRARFEEYALDIKRGLALIDNVIAGEEV